MCVNKPTNHPKCKSVCILNETTWKTNKTQERNRDQANVAVGLRDPATRLVLTSAFCTKDQHLTPFALSQHTHTWLCVALSGWFVWCSVVIYGKPVNQYTIYKCLRQRIYNRCWGERETRSRRRTNVGCGWWKHKGEVSIRSNRFGRGSAWVVRLWRSVGFLWWL